MRCERFRDGRYFAKGYANHLPREFMAALKDELAIFRDDCTDLEGIALYRAQGGAAILKELIEVLENGADAPLPDSGLSSVRSASVDATISGEPLVV